MLTLSQTKFELYCDIWEKCIIAWLILSLKIWLLLLKSTMCFQTVAVFFSFSIPANTENYQTAVNILMGVFLPLLDSSLPSGYDRTFRMEEKNTEEWTTAVVTVVYFSGSSHASFVFAPCALTFTSFLTKLDISCSFSYNLQNKNNSCKWANKKLTLTDHPVWM